MTRVAPDITRQILDQARALGFALAGVCRAEPTQFRDELRRWLGESRHGEMSFLEKDNALREDPRGFSVAIKPGDTRRRQSDDDGILPVRSFVIVADQYAPRNDAALQPTPPTQHHAGRIARYAQGADYHRVIKSRLHDLSDSLRDRFPDHGFMSFVDTTPVLERELALLAGLGWIGKHTLLINARLGSWFLLGGVGTSLDLEPPPEQSRDTDHCGTCTRCIDACPTQAISPYSVDATRCISYLTIEHRSLIPAEHHSSIDHWWYGCDICQEVCPHNSPRADSSGRDAVRPEYQAGLSTIPLLDVLSWGEDERRAAFRGSAMKRISLSMAKRNALIAAANAIRAATHPSGQARPCEAGQAGGTRQASDAGQAHGKSPSNLEASVLARIRDLAHDEHEPELVRATAQQVLQSLNA